MESRFLGYPADSYVIIPTALYLLSPAVNPKRQAMDLVTLRRMRVSTVAVEKKVLHILSVWLVLGNAHAPCCHP